MMEYIQTQSANTDESVKKSKSEMHQKSRK